MDRWVWVLGTGLVLLSGGFFPIRAGEWMVPGDVPTIEEAIEVAEEGDTVLVQDGTYVPPAEPGWWDPAGKAITLRSQNGPGRCVLDGRHAGPLFVIHTGEGRGTVISGFTVVNGYNPLSSPTEGRGGAIWIRRASPTIRGCVFRGNEAEDRGGAIYVEDGDPLIEEGWFEENVVHWTGPPESLESERCAGGAVLVTGRDSDPVIRDCVFRSNAAVADTLAYGGAVGFTYPLGHIGSALRIERCRFDGNAAGMAGGAICGLHGGPVRIVDCVFRRNRSAIKGGAVWIHGLEEDRPQIRGSEFLGNVAGSGGGLFICRATAEVFRCTFAANRAVRWGGGSGVGAGLSCANTHGRELMLDHLTFYANEAERDGDAIYVAGCRYRVFLRNSIVWNKAPAREIGVAEESLPCRWFGVDDPGDLVDVDYSDVLGGWPYGGVGNIDRPPHIRWRSGLSLRSDSPAVDAGDPTERVPAGGGSRVDMGWREYVGSNPAVVP